MKQRANLVVKGCNDMTSVAVVAFKGSSYEVEPDQMGFAEITIELVSVFACPSENSHQIMKLKYGSYPVMKLNNKMFSALTLETVVTHRAQD